MMQFFFGKGIKHVESFTDGRETYSQTDARQNVILKLNYEDLRSGKLKTVLISEKH